jgi:hypothetical protein
MSIDLGILFIISLLLCVAYLIYLVINGIFHIGDDEDDC